MGRAFDLAAPPDQVRIAGLGVSLLRIAAPRVSAAVASALDGSPAMLLKGLPIGGSGDDLTAAMLSLLRGGEIFQYDEQSGGQLIASIRPRPDGAPNSNASGEPFGFHTDDAIMPARFRVEEISLLSIRNPVGTFTGFTFLEDIL